MIQILYILSKSLVGLYFLLRILDVEKTYSQHKENQIKYPKAYIITKYLIIPITIQYPNRIPIQGNPIILPIHILPTKQNK